MNINLPYRSPEHSDSIQLNLAAARPLYKPI